MEGREEDDCGPGEGHPHVPRVPEPYGRNIANQDVAHDAPAKSRRKRQDHPSEEVHIAADGSGRVLHSEAQRSRPVCREGHPISSDFCRWLPRKGSRWFTADGRPPTGQWQESGKPERPHESQICDNGSKG